MMALCAEPGRTVHAGGMDGCRGASTSAARHRTHGAADRPDPKLEIAELVGAFRDWRDELLGTLETRKQPLFADGFDPISESNYDRVRNTIGTTIGTLLDEHLERVRDAHESAAEPLPVFPPVWTGCSARAT